MKKKRIIYWLIPTIVVISLLIIHLIFRDSSLFSDRIFILYKDSDNNTNALMVRISKYDILPHFYHYEYLVSLTGNDMETKVKKYDYNSIKNNYRETDFIKNIKNENNENILNENYSMKIEIENTKFDISLKDMTGDFLINNSLNRFTYVNMGTTEISIDGTNHKANFILNKTASTDYKDLMSQFPDSKGIAIFFADASGTQYYVDISEVFEISSSYLSHTWVLKKKDQILEKHVGEGPLLITNDNNNIILDLPIFNNARAEFKKIKEFYLANNFYSLIEGKLINDNEEKTITGFALYYNDLN